MLSRPPELDSRLYVLALASIGLFLLPTTLLLPGLAVARSVRA